MFMFPKFLSDFKIGNQCRGLLSSHTWCTSSSLTILSSTISAVLLPALRRAKFAMINIANGRVEMMTSRAPLNIRAMSASKIPVNTPEHFPNIRKRLLEPLEVAYRAVAVARTVIMIPREIFGAAIRTLSMTLIRISVVRNRDILSCSCVKRKE